LAWTIKYSDSALKSLKKMDRHSATRIVNYFDRKVATLDDPRALGKSLKGVLGEFWRYRVGDFRILCVIQDSKITVTATKIGHRKDVYKA
jgi:mRNA interferase RelE/StbE